MLAQDILLDENGDIGVTLDGDLGVEYSDVQHQVDIRLAFPGHFRNYPFCGFGIRTLQNVRIDTEALAFYRQKLKYHLELDGYVVERCDIAKYMLPNGTNEIKTDTKVYRP